jgi:membrane protein
MAAEIAYYGLFSLFPFLFFLRALVPYLPGQEQLTTAILDSLAGFLGAESRLYDIVKTYVVDALQVENPALLSAGLVLTLWSASSAFNRVILAVNRAYGVPETRPWYRRRVLAIVITLCSVALALVGVAFIVLGPGVASWLETASGMGPVLGDLWVLLRWPLVACMLAAALWLVYRFAPSVRIGWLRLVPGSIVVVIAVMLFTQGFSWFLSSSAFELRWLTYGAIGAVIVLLFWMYAIGLVVLVGGELNAALDRRLAERKGQSGEAQDALLDSTPEPSQASHSPSPSPVRAETGITARPGLARRTFSRMRSRFTSR